MFIDETAISVQAGDGGNGCFAHERQKFKPRGRPDGGRGGRGGHIFMVADSQVHTLQDVSYRRTYKAERGVHGKGSNKDGRHGEDMTITVPLGTIVINDETGVIMHDCLEEGKPFILARGGPGRQREPCPYVPTKPKS